MNGTTKRSMRWLLAACCLVGVAVLGACGTADPAASTAAPLPAQLPVGDAANGQTVFARQCASCHSTGTDMRIGPGLAGLFAPGGPSLPSSVDYGGKLPNGQPITDLNVAAWIRQGGRGQIGTMPKRNLDDQSLADVIAYMRTLQK